MFNFSRGRNPVVLVSGGFDPVHSGHVNLFESAAKYGDLVVALNSDEWLKRKKGFAFLPWEERAKIIRAFSCVKDVISFNDEDGTALDAIKKVKPDMFANGGDRIFQNTPETFYCREKEISMLFNIGGKKTNSSSKIVAEAGLKRVEFIGGEKKVLYQTDKHRISLIEFEKETQLGKIRNPLHDELWCVLEGGIFGKNACVKGKSFLVAANDWHELSVFANTKILLTQFGKNFAENKLEIQKDFS